MSFLKIKELIMKNKKIITICIFVAAVVALVIVYLNYNKEPIKTVPAILEDSLSDDTNLILDTVTGESKDSNQIEVIEKPRE
jgi:hypothetical protein